jgi:hypothetical protein
MRGRSPKLAVLVASTVATVLLLPAAVSAAAPDHETFAFPISFVDTATCGFPIVGEYEFRNMIIDGAVATGTGTLQLHQSNVGTLTAKGVTLRQSDHYTISVDFVDGVPRTATWTGNLEYIRGPNDYVFHRTGQAVFEVVFDPVLGFYVDGPLVTRHGLRANFDAAPFCAAFS